MKITNKIEELNTLIKQSSNVFLMAHADLDLDAINSCMGMSYYLTKMGKKSYIIVDDKIQEAGVKKVIIEFRNTYSLIKSKKVKELINENSLLIILDTSKEKIVQAQDVIPLFNKIINIDHHDYTNESIKSTLCIIDEQSSSTCEMITLLFKEKNVKIPSKLATLLLSGIVLDTNYFQLKTDADTFYYAYYLMNCGADMNGANRLLKQNLKDYIKRQKIITSVQVIKNVAIGSGRQRTEYRREDIAKSADILLTFDKIKASFVVAKISKDLVGISGRSNGEINVGKILEQFGGGGGESEAAAKISGVKINDVIEDLRKIIRSL